MTKVSKKEKIKKLKYQAKLHGVILSHLFPKSNLNYSKLSDYQIRKISRKIKDVIENPPPSKKRKKYPRKKKEKIFAPRGAFWSDAPERFKSAGFHALGDWVFPSQGVLKMSRIYRSEGELSFYSGNIFAGTVHVVLIPTAKLPLYLENGKICDKLDNTYYDKISIREGEFKIHNQDTDFQFARGFTGDSHEDLLLYIEQYKRRGLLTPNLPNAGGWWGDYFQLCYIKFGVYDETETE